MDIIKTQDITPQMDLGGKAMGLSRLTNAKANVPEFFVVSPEAFLSHFPKDEWNAFVENPDAEHSKVLCSAIMSHPWSESLTRAVKEALSEFPDDALFAVRSSMIGEDGAEFSFAGQLESFLFQQGEAAVVHSIRECWCSAFQDRVLQYRARAGLNVQNISMAVVVQRMVFSETAGVLFTAHPQTGHRSRMLVSAAYGQGEGVVSGACNADEIVWHKKDGILSYTVADKDRMIVRAAEAGVIEVDVPQEKRDLECVSKEVLTKLCVQSHRLEKEFGYPLDIEWAQEGEEVYFLQARPITSLPEAPNEEGPKVVWDNSNIQESYCGVTTPLTFSYAQRAYETVYRQTMVAVGISKEEIEKSAHWRKNLLGLVRGRIFYNINSWYEGLTLLPSFGRNKEDMEKMMGLEDPVDFVHDQTFTIWEKLQKIPGTVKNAVRLYLAFRNLPKSVPQFQDHYETIAKDVTAESVEKMSFSSLMELNEYLRQEIQEKWHIPIINDFYVMMSTGALRRYLEKNGVEDALSVQKHRTTRTTQ